MKAVVDRIVQYANRYQLTNIETGEVLGTFDFDEVTGTVQQVGTEIDKELFDSIANDLAARVKLSGGELAETVVTFSDISGTAANVASGDTSATLWGKVKNWFSRLKALAFKNKVAAGDFEAGAIKNADIADDAAIAQSKVSGLKTDYVASISVSGRTVTYKNKNGVNMGSITTQDTTYGLASQSSNGLMSSTDKTKLDGIESGAQKNTVLGVKGGSESAYRTGNVNITKANIGLGNVDNTSDADKPVSKATQTALNGKANTSGSYPNLSVGKATQDENGNVIDETYATKTELVEATGTKVKVNGATQPEVNFTSDPQTQITANKNAIAEAQSDISDIISGKQTAKKAEQDANGNNIPDTYALLPTSVTDTGRASGQWVVGTGGTPVSGKTMLLGTFSIYDTNIWLHISGGVARGESSNYTTDANVFISSLQGTVNEAYCYVRKLYTSSRTTGIYYTVDSSRRLRIYAAVPQYGKMFVSAEVSGGSIAGRGSSEDAYPSGGAYLERKDYAFENEVISYLGNVSPNDVGVPNKAQAFYIPNGADGSPSSGAGWAITGGSNGSYGAQIAAFDEGKLYYRYKAGKDWLSWESVLKTDPSKLEPSTANGWTQTTATGSLPSAGVYLISARVDFLVNGAPQIMLPKAPAIGVFMPDNSSIRGCAIFGMAGLTCTMEYNSDDGNKWSATITEPSVTGVEVKQVYYKRIA